MAPSEVDNSGASQREDSYESPKSESASDVSLDEEDNDQEYAEETDEEQLQEESESSDDAMMSSPDAITAGEVEEAFHPLRTVADRVGQQVEHFAETLDKYNVKKRRHKRVDHKRVLNLVGEYKKIALDTVKQLEGLHGPELQDRLNRKRDRHTERSSRHPNTSDEDKDFRHLGLKTTVADLQRWQIETQTWELLEVLLQARYRELRFGTQKPDEIGLDVPSKVHRYSSESEVWIRFVAEDDLARERNTVLKWLTRCADSCGPNINTLTEHLETDAERGTGLWAHGWLYTKEAVKAQKRLRSWPQALDPTSPGIEDTHLSSDYAETLVTQLDPDATSRQDRSLERQDQNFENATWLTCWQMIRRGKSWDTIREWCQERVEGWRAISLRGHLSGSSTPHAGKSSQITTTNGMTNVQSGFLWRKMCYAAAKDTTISVYESAVYGVLAGDIDTVEEVCRSWDDFLFVYYNGLLLHQFDTYLHSKLSHRLSTTLATKFSSPSCAVFHDDPNMVSRALVEKLKTQKLTKKEAKNPLKRVQGSLIADTFVEFVASHGQALAGEALAQGKSKIIPPKKHDLREDTNTAYIAFEDYDSLRVLTHMIFIFQDLGVDFRRSAHCSEIENVVVAYIDFLKLAGKSGMLPLYASRLSWERTQSCLGRELNDITVPQERKMLVELMKQLDINVVPVIMMQMRLIINDIRPYRAAYQRAKDFKILEDGDSSQQMLRPIRKNFIGEDISDDEQALLRCFEWVVLLEGQWYLTMAAGATLYRHFLVYNRLAAARALSKSASFSRLVAEKSEFLLGAGIDVSGSLDISDDEEDEDPGTSRMTRLRERQIMRRSQRDTSGQRRKALSNYMNNMSTTFTALEQLVVALDALETWANIADQLKTTTHPTGAKTWKSQLRSATEKVVAVVEPLLNGWLLHPERGKFAFMPDNVDAARLAELREAYLPEVLLAYNSVLHFAGHAISRELLLQCMEFAASVAAQGSDVAACFISAGRMRELVDALAITSKAILKANEQGSKVHKGRKKASHGESLNLWTVKSS